MKDYLRFLLNSTSSQEYTAIAVEDLSGLRTEKDRLQKEYALLRECHDQHYQDFLTVNTEKDRLRALVGHLVSEAHGYKPYARPPTTDDWECVYCERQWSYGGSEHHADDCPVVAAREFMEEG